MEREKKFLSVFKTTPQTENKICLKEKIIFKKNLVILVLLCFNIGRGSHCEIFAMDISFACFILFSYVSFKIFFFNFEF